MNTSLARVDWVAIHETAAAEYDHMAAETDDPRLARIYRDLATKRRVQAAAEHRSQPTSSTTTNSPDAPDFYWLDYPEMQPD